MSDLAKVAAKAAAALAQPQPKENRRQTPPAHGALSPNDPRSEFTSRSTVPPVCGIAGLSPVAGRDFTCDFAVATMATHSSLPELELFVRLVT